MARTRSPRSIEAEKLYHEGMKLVDIAKKIGVPDSTVRRWKSTQKWDGDKCGQDKKKANARKKEKRTLGNKKELQKAIRMLPGMPHLPPKGIKTLKSMERIQEYGKCIRMCCQKKNAY